MCRDRSSRRNQRALDAARSVRMLVVVGFLDTGSDVFLADPHATFDRLRAEDWLVDDATGLSLIGYAACDAAFHDPALVPGIDWLLEDRGFGHLWGVDGHTL